MIANVQNSTMFRSDKFKMYKKESADFVKSLRVKTNQLAFESYLWERYLNLIKIDLKTN